MTAPKQLLYLAHGWGMPSVIWTPILTELQQNFQVQILDLPGYATIPNTTTAYNSFADLAATIMPQLQQPGIFLGWSLGGMLGFELAKSAPDKILKLITVASNIKFTQADDWPHAVEQQNLNQFAWQLTNDYHATLSRFLTLQLHGSTTAKNCIRILKNALANSRAPCQTALDGGLQLLANSDLRSTLRQISTKVLMLFGRTDKLVPHSVIDYINAQFPQIETQLISGAAHAPFLSHPTVFLNRIGEFCYDDFE